MKYFFSFVLTAFGFTFASAQTTTDSVKAAVSNLFTGMITSNPALITSSFSDNAVLQTIEIKEGKPVVQTDQVKEFADAISKIAKGDAEERIQFDVVKIDDNLAIVWAPYSFYYKGKFSHCGVDSFQLVRINGTWKIQYLIDTRRKDGCAMPGSGK